MLEVERMLVHAAAIAASVLFGGSLLAEAQQASPSKSMPGMTMTRPDGSNPEIKAFSEANEKMHAAMNSPLTGNADWDFALNMIPHHQGAIDMARAELRYGADPEMRKLAKSVIAAQEKEIALMKLWQQRHN